MAWNLLAAASEKLVEKRNTYFCKQVINTFADAWNKANV